VGSAPVRRPQVLGSGGLGSPLGRLGVAFRVFSFAEACRSGRRFTAAAGRPCFRTHGPQAEASGVTRVNGSQTFYIVGIIIPASK
jgi:hypothetical protein